MKLYDTFGQSIEFAIDPKYKKIAVNLSGGADSSILLYMVAAYIQKHNMNDVSLSVLTCANDFKHRWNARKAANVINFVIDQLEFTQIDMHYSYYRDVQDEKYFHEVEFRLVDEGHIDLLISGITSNPNTDVAMVIDANDILINLKTEALTIRNKTTHNVLSVGEKSDYYCPFINVDKRFIAAMYILYNVTDTLFPITRSCEATPTDGNKYDNSYEYTPCGLCWWCLERKWAFGRF